MKKNDKIALAQILISFGIGVGFTLYSVVLTRKAKAAKQLEADAVKYATAEVLRLFLNEDSVRNKDDFEREFQFAYMNYLAHN
jgi:hypothetical protein